MTPDQRAKYNRMATENARMAKDQAATETRIRELAAQVLPQSWLDGDSHGVPSVEDVVERLTEQTDSEKQTRIQYQEIVYGVCNLIDRATGCHATKGNCLTIDKVLDKVRDLTTDLMVSAHQHEEDLKALECVGLAQDSDLWAALKEQRDKAIERASDLEKQLAASARWHRRPTVPGRWVIRWTTDPATNWRVYEIASDEVAKVSTFTHARFFGPIPDAPEDVK